jgi:hypothetical protein
LGKKSNWVTVLSKDWAYLPENLDELRIRAIGDQDNFLVDLSGD